jgi:anthranilate phosphoribosyltransferase
MIKEAIQKLVDGKNLTYEESGEAMSEIMSGKTTNSQISAFLTALRMKGETVEEITAFARVMRENCRRIHPNVNGRLLDTCGTGGDKTKTFNVSTISAFIIAGTGISVAKHGNRSVTSRSGSADVLERLGFNLKMEPQQVQNSIEQVGIGFMFAPVFHPAMKYAVEPRREIGIRTVFNILGPLTNPACADAQLLGVYDYNLTKTLAHVLKNLGCTEAMVVHGLEGLDEISTVGKTAVAQLANGEIVNSEITPRDFGVKKTKTENLKGTDPEESADLLFRILKGHLAEEDPRLEIALVNAAAGILIGGKAEDFREGMESARESISSGAAYKKLESLIKASGGDLTKLEELESKYD